MVIVLVFVTLWYAYLTRSMAKIMNKEYALSSMPFLTIEREVDRDFGEMSPKNKLLRLKFHYTNVGRVPVQYYTKEVMLNGINITPKKVEPILFPGQKGVLHSVMYSSEQQIGQGDNLKGSIEIVYWAVGLPKKKTSFIRKFVLAPKIVAFIEEENIKEIS
jgi:archaellum component FlaF (FlaF/FlaG flagellin family)